MSMETLELAPAQTTAERLTRELLNKPQQLQLFDTARDRMAFRWVEDLKSTNPGKLVLPSEVVNEFRYRAAFLGAGFHASQYEDVMFTKSDPELIGRLVFTGLWALERKRVQASYPTSNRMRDEVNEELFIYCVPTTKYDLSTGHYVTSAEDLQKIFEFDYVNLAACRDMDFDLLYEREA